MPYYDLAEYLSDDALTLDGIASEKYPKGKAYRIKSPSGKLVLQLQRITQIRMQSGTDEPLSDEVLADLLVLVTDDAGAPVDFNERLFGPTWQEMVDDGVSGDRMEMIRQLVVTHYGHGAAIAQAVLAAAAGEAQARGNRATRRATKRTAKKTAGSKSPRASTATTGAAKATASPTSGSSTSPTGPEGQAQAV